MHFVSAYKTHHESEKLVIHIAASMHVPFQRPKRPFNVHHLPIQEISLLLTFPPRLRDHVSDEFSTVLHLYLSQRTHFFDRRTNEDVWDSCAWYRHAFASIVSQMLGRTVRNERVLQAFELAQSYPYCSDTILFSSSIFLVYVPGNIFSDSHDTAQDDEICIACPCPFCMKQTFLFLRDRRRPCENLDRWPP